jgi:hypothetical protein
VPLVVSCFWWIAAPTREGRALLDHIAGFRQYLSITERERLDRMTAPEDTPEVFEKYLPYAIALGVENRWANRFASVLAAAAAQLGSSRALVARRPGSWEADLVIQLVCGTVGWNDEYLQPTPDGNPQ